MWVWKPAFSSWSSIFRETLENGTENMFTLNKGGNYGYLYTVSSKTWMRTTLGALLLPFNESLLGSKVRWREINGRLSVRLFQFYNGEKQRCRVVASIKWNQDCYIFLRMRETTSLAANENFPVWRKNWCQRKQFWSKIVEYTKSEDIIRILAEGLAFVSLNQ